MVNQLEILGGGRATLNHAQLYLASCEIRIAHVAADRSIKEHDTNCVLRFGPLGRPLHCGCVAGELSRMNIFPPASILTASQRSAAFSCSEVTCMPSPLLGHSVLIEGCVPTGKDESGERQVVEKVDHPRHSCVARRSRSCRRIPDDGNRTSLSWRTLSTCSARRFR